MVDPTPLPTTLLLQMMKKLRTLKEKQVRHDSHLQFVKDSLKNKVTPRGMKIKTSLQAEDTDKRLRKRWNNTIQATQVNLLKLLKIHHRERDESLKNEILDLVRETRELGVWCSHRRTLRND